MPKYLLSIIVHGYNNQSTLRLQEPYWHAWQLKDQIEFIFIDDGSSPPLLLDKLPSLTRRYRIHTDIKWNQPGAKNLGANFALGEWFLFYDLDHFVDNDFLVALLDKIKYLKEDTIYKFNRFCIKRQKFINPHINSFLIHRDGYNLIGGFDEDFSGNYGSEDVYFHQRWLLLGKAITTLDNPILSVDHSLKTSGLIRDTRINRKLRKKKIRFIKVNRFIGKHEAIKNLILSVLISLNLIVKDNSNKSLLFRWNKV
jgi:predicted glycosyltransferase involved in capsule biosynthesis